MWAGPPFSYNATAENPQKSHAPNKNSLEGPCCVHTRDTLQEHI